MAEGDIMRSRLGLALEVVTTRRCLGKFLNAPSALSRLLGALGGLILIPDVLLADDSVAVTIHTRRVCD